VDDGSGTGGATNTPTTPTTETTTTTTGTTGTTGTTPLSAAATLKRAKLACKRKVKAGRKILSCKLQLPANAAPAKTIGLTARAGKKVVVRLKLRMRKGAAAFVVPATAKTFVLALGKATVTRPVKVSR
jgi:hypothetical protein